jgi:hypothetical protein
MAGINAEQLNRATKIEEAIRDIVAAVDTVENKNLSEEEAKAKLIMLGSCAAVQIFDILTGK